LQLSTIYVINYIGFIIQVKHPQSSTSHAASDDDDDDDDDVPLVRFLDILINTITNLHKWPLYVATFLSLQGGSCGEVCL